MKNDHGNSICAFAVLNGAILALALQSPAASAKTLGLVADDVTRTVTVFDADTDTVLGSVITSGAGFGMGDVQITPDQTRGFVTNFNSEIFVIDLTASPPRLAEGPNPIPISNPGEDLAISPDGKFLLVSDGGVSGPISVIEIASQTEVHTLSVGSDTTSIEVCSDGSVLATSIYDQTVRRLVLSATGALTDTGERLSFDDGPNNVICAPDGTSGLAVIRDYPSGIRSFKVPGLQAADARPLSGTSGISGLINAAGDRVYVRNNGDFVNDKGFVGVFGAVDVYGYDAVAATLSAAPLFSIPVAYGPLFYGMDQMALHPGNAKLYVSEPNALKVYDAKTGALLRSITDPNIVDPTGVVVAAATDSCAGRPPAGAIVGTDGPDALRGTPGDDVIYGLGGDDAIDGRGGDDLICGGDGDDRIEGGPGDDFIDGGAGQDRIEGGPGKDTLDGGPGANLCAADPEDTVQNCNPHFPGHPASSGRQSKK
ncbi:hypothetical protein ACWJKU_16675 [Methylocaldum sp. MU1018]